ncbi:MAG: DUF3850 domain-containing protein [Candidatus Sungiibacteriota bacterium]|uniref:DUF3850 domain-containing protein n=1 Tax=Candidatus Sungiibacteriota bacterium TaxID=2750080 RepID=A0A7T5RJ31_9BACT|nr:MAG: DUF3850 domain-containing protein [Candidatus Sungbacteria bacterium]
MRTITKKTWPEYFKKVRARKKNVELRLADFKISKGDILLLQEWDPKKKIFTGRSVKRRVAAVHKVNMAKFHSQKKLTKYGLYAIEMK